MSKIRVSLEIEVDSEECKRLGITEQEVVDSISLRPDDVVDAVMIFQAVPGIDNTSDIVLGDGWIISKELIM